MGGGGYDGGLPTDTLRKLEEKAKQKLKEASEDVSRNVFISFAYEDADEVNLLRGQAKDEKTDLEFKDYSVKEAFDSKDADYIKRQIREKMDKTSVTIVYLSPHSAKSPWVNWEIEESLKRGKGVIGVYKGDTPPAALPKAFSDNNCEAVKWSHENLKKAIEKASKNR
jgi:hypothetical protein